MKEHKGMGFKAAQKQIARKEGVRWLSELWRNRNTDLALAFITKE